MIRDLEDEEYFEISGKGNPKGVLDEIEKLLLSLYIIEKAIAENCTSLMGISRVISLLLNGLILVTNTPLLPSHKVIG